MTNVRMMLPAVCGLGLLGLGLLGACGGTARNMQTYRADTQNLLASRSSQVEQCYQQALTTDASAGGTVTVQFVVAKKTGMISKATIDPAHTTAPAALGDCVLQAVEGLVLNPPDRNEGRATFTYEFKPQEGVTGAAAPSPT